MTTRFTRVAGVVGYGGGHSTLTVHRALADPAADGRPTFTRLHDLLIEQLPPVAAPRVLDAGCGAGGTMLDLAERLGATCTGLGRSERIGPHATPHPRRRDRETRPAPP